MTEQLNERFAGLIRLLTLRTITPTELRSQRLGAPPPDGTELKLESNQALASGDPVAADPDLRVFRPKYEFSVRQGDNLLFHQTSIFVVAFSVADLKAFDELWADEDIRKIFTERQLQRTMWPIFRQHVLDGMSRLGMPPVPLPWLM